MQKQTKKYILSMLIATMLLLSMLPLVVPVQADVTAIDTPAVDQQVEAGEEVWVNGTAGVGELVKVYWEIETGDNLLGEDYAVGGVFNISIVIPEALAGYHYILLRPATSPLDSTRLEVIPVVTLTPDTGLTGDTVTVDGSGFGEEEDVTLRLSNATTMDMSLTTSPSDVTTSVNGSFTCTFDIPSNASYGVYDVAATDAAANSATVTLTVGATITLDVVEGPSGTEVEVTGRGFTETAGRVVTITFSNTTAFTAPQVADIDTRSDGTFTGDIIVPTLDVDTYDVVATDEDAISSGAVEFDVTGKSGITLTPNANAPDSDITIEGVNFTAIADTEVTLTIIDIGVTEVTLSETFTTNTTGGFEGTFTIPVDPRLYIRTAPYLVNASDENDLYGKVELRIVRTIAAVYPDEGPTGKEVEVWASGLTQSLNYNITINGDLMVGAGAEGTLDANGELPSGTTIYIPSVPVGEKTITVMDTDGVTATSTFTVTATTELILDPSSAPVDYNVTMEMNSFIQINRTDITLTIYNDTWDDDLMSLIVTADKGAASHFELLRTNATGSFYGWFKVPDDLIVGESYMINATDGDLEVTEVSFSVVLPTVDMYTRLSEYVPGETVSFYIRSTFKDAFTVTVEDPAGTTSELAIELADWAEVEELYVVRYEESLFMLPSDAETGAWSWDAEISDLELNGAFSVVDAPTGAAVAERLAAVDESLAVLSDAVDDLSTTVGTSASDIDALGTAVSAVSSTVDALETDIANAASAASSAQTAAEAAEAAAAAANTTAQGISMAVYGSMALSLIAAIAAIAAVLTLQRKVAG